MPPSNNTRYHRISADAVVIKNNKVLMMKRAIQPHQNSYVLPGGAVEPAKSPTDTVLRELKEETNITGRVKKFINYYFINDKKIEPRGPVYNFVFLVEYQSGQLKNDFESSEFKWFSLDQLPKKVGFHHRTIISDYIKICS